jgi:hypothetical protein
MVLLTLLIYFESLFILTMAWYGHLRLCVSQLGGHLRFLFALLISPSFRIGVFSSEGHCLRIYSPIHLSISPTPSSPNFLYIMEMSRMGKGSSGVGVWFQNLVFALGWVGVSMDSRRCRTALESVSSSISGWLRVF